jgi:aldehyde dehydrogenase (NAD+)
VPVTLELGGKSPQIVFSDANIDEAVPFLLKAGLQNAGQTCSASSRILIQNSVYSKVERILTEAYKKLSVGPAIEDFDVGPLISKKQAKTVESFLKFGSDLNKLAEAKINPLSCSRGSFVAPTLFGDLDPQHMLSQEEIFGPIQVLIPFNDEEEAVKIANGTKYGLVAGLWTKDGSRQMRMAKSIKAGQIFINNYGAGGGVELPFGGVGHSGFGREKGIEALNSFSILKTVAVNHG